MKKILIIVVVHVGFIHLTPQVGRGQVNSFAPLSSLVAITHEQHRDIATFVKTRVDAYAFGKRTSTAFPLLSAISDTVRTLDELRSQVVIKWLDPLTLNSDSGAPRYGANNDYVAYFGDGWDQDWQGDIVGRAPQFNGSGQAGWLWVNHESVSDFMPTPTSAPTGQHATLAKFLQTQDILTNDVAADRWSQANLDTYITHYKRQIGGSWFRVIQDPSSGKWSVDRRAGAVRFDATSDTLARLTGHTRTVADRDDSGNPLPNGVTVGILGDCSGAQTPWGTVISAEENVQDYYGDLEICWNSNQKFLPGKGCAPGGPVDFPIEASPAGLFALHSNASRHHNRTSYGYLVEIDPRVAPHVPYTSISEGGNGLGHRKLGGIGRARWENATIVVDTNWQLLTDQPIVIYAGNDRPSGRLYKWVSTQAYTPGMTRSEIRALLEDGTLFVAHFSGLDNRTGNTLLGGRVPSRDAPGTGRWVQLSITSPDIAPNAQALGTPTKTVGAALTDPHWNNMGAFLTNDIVRQALFTAAAKIGVMELNRPEDVEWNPKDPSGTPLLYIAFTNHTRGTQLDQEGKLLARTVADERNDANGEIFALQEADPSRPALSKRFTYFQVWKGSTDETSVFAAANPDNLMIDRNGGVWFSTDGNFGRTNGQAADALYYLDLDPTHQAGQPGVVSASYGKAFRIAAVPSDAEATGPAFSSDMKTLFLSVQHPGDRAPSTWPQDRTNSVHPSRPNE